MRRWANAGGAGCSGPARKASSSRTSRSKQAPAPAVLSLKRLLSRLFTRSLIRSTIRSSSRAISGGITLVGALRTFGSVCPVPEKLFALLWSSPNLCLGYFLSCFLFSEVQARWWAVCASCKSGTSRASSKNIGDTPAAKWCARLDGCGLTPFSLGLGFHVSGLLESARGGCIVLSPVRQRHRQRPKPTQPLTRSWQKLLNEQFIEFFDIDQVSIPARRPKWLATQMRM
jgi:hypothetical protein